MEVIFLQFVFLSCFLLLAHSQTSYVFNPNSLTKFNDFDKAPKNNEKIQTGGRLIERHLGYLSEAGFKGVLSVVQFPTNDTVYNGVSGNFPSSDYEMSLVGSYGMKGKYFVSTLTVESANAISKLIDEMPKPLYVHCHVSLYFF
jgi:hypothetical protein